jgi:quinol monooxygenase YgiN
MGFVQIVQYRTSRPDEVRALAEEFRAEAPGSRAVRVTACRDRDGQDRYVTVAEFPSYEEAMGNSSAPATQKFAARMAELCDGPPTFLNLDFMDRFGG